MADKKILTIATLGVAIVGLIGMANDKPELKAELEKFKVDFEVIAKDASEKEEELAEANEVINDLKEQLEGALDVKAEKSDKPTVKVDGVTYQVNHGAHPYSALQISKSEEIAKNLLKIEGQNVLTKLQ